MLNGLLIGVGVRAIIISRLWGKLPIDVLQKARVEISPGKGPHISVTHSILDFYKRQLLPGPKCPRLDAVYQETLRVVNHALSARKIIAPTVVGGKTLHSPHTILISMRQLQYNKQVFGDDPGRFEPEHFLHNKSLSSSPKFRPFGGGVNYFPRRFLTKQEIFVFVALSSIVFTSHRRQNLDKASQSLISRRPL